MDKIDIYRRGADARLTSVSCQRGQTQRRNLSDCTSLGIDRTRTDCLWHGGIASLVPGFAPRPVQQRGLTLLFHEPEQIGLRSQNT